MRPCHACDSVHVWLQCLKASRHVKLALVECSRMCAHYKTSCRPAQCTHGDITPRDTTRQCWNMHTTSQHARKYLAQTTWYTICITAVKHVYRPTSLYTQYNSSRSNTIYCRFSLVQTAIFARLRLDPNSGYLGNCWKHDNFDSLVMSREKHIQLDWQKK